MTRIDDDDEKLDEEKCLFIVSFVASDGMQVNFAKRKHNMSAFLLMKLKELWEYELVTL